MKYDKNKSPQDKDRMLYEIAFAFLKGRSTCEIAAEINRRHRVRMTREEVYPALRKAVELDMLLFNPPTDLYMRERLAQFPNKGDIVVVNAEDDFASSGVSLAAAEKVLQLIREIAARSPGRQVHLGLGVGLTTKDFFIRLVMLLRHDEKIPPLVIHELSASFSFWTPEETPAAYSTYLSRPFKVHDRDASPSFVGMASAPFFPAETYDEKVKDLMLQRALAEKKDIDIIVTSLGSLGTRCEDGYLHQYLTKFPEGLTKFPEGALDELLKQGARGDVQLRPYSDAGPLRIEHGPKPVTLFEIHELVDFTRNKGKHVVLICGPCRRCGEIKKGALLPLLREPSLGFWNHLVVDLGTAHALLPELPAPSEDAQSPTGRRRRKSA